MNTDPSPEAAKRIDRLTGYTVANGLFREQAARIIDEALEPLRRENRELLTFAECEHAMRQYDSDGSSFTAEKLIAVLKKHGWSKPNSLVGCRQWIDDLLKAALQPLANQQAAKET